MFENPLQIVALRASHLAKRLALLLAEREDDLPLLQDELTGAIHGTGGNGMRPGVERLDAARQVGIARELGFEHVERGQDVRLRAGVLAPEEETNRGGQVARLLPVEDRHGVHDAAPRKGQVHAALAELAVEQRDVEPVHVESRQIGVGKVTISVDPGKKRLRVEKDGVVAFGQEFEMESGGNPC